MLSSHFIQYDYKLPHYSSVYTLLVELRTAPFYPESCVEVFVFAMGVIITRLGRQWHLLFSVHHRHIDKISCTEYLKNLSVAPTPLFGRLSSQTKVQGRHELSIRFVCLFFIVVSFPLDSLFSLLHLQDVLAINKVCQAEGTLGPLAHAIVWSRMLYY